MRHICILLPEMVPYVQQANTYACLLFFTEVVPYNEKDEIL
jgi:hypothetical protein